MTFTQTLKFDLTFTKSINENPDDMTDSCVAPLFGNQIKNVRNLRHYPSKGKYARVIKNSSESDRQFFFMLVLC